MFLSFSVIFLSAVEDLTWTLEGMFWRLAGIKDYFEILDTPIEVQDAAQAKKLSRVKGDISFKNLSFSYDDKRKVLQNINIDIPAGEKIAFV
jgi:ATP-binding cassette subfamily B protein